MDCSLKTPPYFEEFEQEPNSNIGFEQEPISGSSSLGGPGNKGDFSVDLKLGHVVFGNESVDNLPPKMASGSSKRARASEQLNLAMAEKAYVEEARRQARKQMELAHLESANAQRITQQVQAEVENAKRIRQQAQSAVENAQVLKEQATKKISSTILQITCHSCKQQFQATTGSAAATAPVDNLPPTMVSGLSQRARAVSIEIQAASCQVDGCQADLSGCTEYYRRHKVCRRHSKTPEVEIRGHKQRLCRQCRRFHPLEEFVEGKRSCRRRLAAHNERRRKPQPEPLSRAGNLLSNYQGTEEATALEASRVMEASIVTKEEESEELKLAMAEKAYAEEARRQAKKQMELAHLELANAQRIMQQAQDEFENAKGISWQQAQAEVENAQVLKEQATKKISSTILQITCHSCKQQFQATTSSAAATAPVDVNSRRVPQPEPFSRAGFRTRDKQNSSKPDPNSRGEEDSEGLQMQMHQHSDATFSMSDREHTSGTAPDGGVSYMEELMVPLNEMGEVVTKRPKLSPEDKESLTRGETDEVSNSSEEELIEEMWSAELEETPSDPRPTISHHFSILDVLDLSYTEIKSLPQSISRLVALQKLYLRNCEHLMQLPPEIGELANLEVLDLEGTKILCLPKEIANLVKLTCLRVSFYGYANQTVIPRKVLPNLSRLNELIIDVTPYGEWWDVEVEAIIDDLRSLKELRALKLYLPTAKLLEELTLIFPGLANFRFTLGRCEEHFISRLPRDIEEEFNNWEKLEKGLKYVNGDRIPNEITKVFKHVNAFFLQCHWTANSLSEFGHENLNEVKFCLVMECNEFRTIIDSEQFYQGNDGRAKSEYFQDFDEAIVLGSLERLIVRYMKNMESIWKGPVGKGSMSSLKSLALHTCLNLTTLFTIDMLSNLINLEELIVEDCPKIDSLVSLKNSGSKSGLFLPSLKKISLLELPGLVSISSGLCIAPKLERMVIFYCPKLEKLSTRDISSTNLKAIKGEEEWWNALKWYESDLSTEHEDYLTSLFIPLRRNGDLFAQLTED